MIYFFAERYIAEARFSAVARPSLIFSVIIVKVDFYAYGTVMTSNVSRTQAILKQVVVCKKGTNEYLQSSKMVRLIMILSLDHEKFPFSKIILINLTF